MSKVSRQELRGQQPGCFSLDTTKHCHTYATQISSQPHPLALTDHCPKEDLPSSVLTNLEHLGTHMAINCKI